MKSPSKRARQDINNVVQALRQQRAFKAGNKKWNTNESEFIVNPPLDGIIRSVEKYHFIEHTRLVKSDTSWRCEGDSFFTPNGKDVLLTRDDTVSPSPAG